MSKGKKIGEEKGTGQKAIEMNERILKRFPDWSDKEIAEEVVKLRRGEKLN